MPRQTTMIPTLPKHGRRPATKSGRAIFALKFSGPALVLSLLVTLLLSGCTHVVPTVVHDKSLSRTVIDGYAFHTETLGSPSSPPVVILHGGPGGDFAYLRSLEALSKNFYVLFYDQRGTGLSEREDPSKHDIDLFLSDLDALVTKHAGKRPVLLVGHSWGGMLAAAYIARHPGRVSRAVIAEPGILTPETAKLFITAMKDSQSLGVMLRAVPSFMGALFVEKLDGHEPGDYAMTGMLSLAEGPPYECRGKKLPEGSFVRGGYQSFDHMLSPLLEDPSRWKWHLARGLRESSTQILMLSSTCSFVGYDYQQKHHRHLFPRETVHLKLKGGHNMFTMPETKDRAVSIVAQFLGTGRL